MPARSRLQRKSSKHHFRLPVAHGLTKSEIHNMPATKLIKRHESIKTALAVYAGSSFGMVTGAPITIAGVSPFAMKMSKLLDESRMIERELERREHASKK